MLREGKNGISNGIIKDMMEGKYPEKVISTGWGDFTVKFPTSKDNSIIERRKALQLTGLPRETFSSQYLHDVHRDVTLSVIISKYPKDFPDAWKEIGIDEFPVEEVKNSILKEFNIFRSTIKEQISGNAS